MRLTPRTAALVLGSSCVMVESPGGLVGAKLLDHGHEVDRPALRQRKGLQRKRRIPARAVQPDSGKGGLPGGQSCSQLVGFTLQGNGARSGSISVGDGGTSVTLTVRGVGQPLPAVGSACLDGRCAGTATCESHSNGQSLVCCGQNCTGNQRCSEGQGFQACELPTVGQGQACGSNVLCNGGLTCNSSTGTCCTSGCGGPCPFCNQNGTCGTTPNGQRGGCGAGQVCTGNGAGCGECARDADCMSRALGA